MASKLESMLHAFACHTDIVAEGIWGIMDILLVREEQTALNR